MSFLSEIQQGKKLKPTETIVTPSFGGVPFKERDGYVEEIEDGISVGIVGEVQNENDEEEGEAFEVEYEGSSSTMGNGIFILN